MPKINEMVLRKIQFDPETGDVGYLLEHPMGALMPASTEERLELVSGTPDSWGNADCLVDAQRCVDEHPEIGGLGYVVVLPKRRPRKAVAPGEPIALLPAALEGQGEAAAQAARDEAASADPAAPDAPADPAP